MIELSEIAQKEDDIMPILKLSYDHLSSQLKQCFAYCALFPKDYEIEKDNLIQLWMAQGFLHTSKKNRFLEDVGNQYLMDLLSGSFLQDLREKHGGVTCKMHDLMHDLAQSVVGSECKRVTSNADNNVDERSRHISFNRNLASLEISNSMLQANRLRTFLPFFRHYIKLNEFHLNKILSNFGRLRTLSLEDLEIEKVPTSIGKLKHLRYLNLSWNFKIKELPDSVSNLINLMTLNLKFCANLQKLPRDMRKMVSLQYLMIDDCDSLASMPRGLGQLDGLRTLPLFVVGERDRKNDALKELKGLNKLKGSLSIKVLGKKKNVNLAQANLEEKQYLESVSLEGNEKECDEMMVEGLKPHPNLKEVHISGNLGSVMFSGCMSSFTNLTEIGISSSSNFRQITPLDQLPSLLTLTLEGLESAEYISESDRVSEGSTSTPTTFFPSLKELTISDCRNLKGWWKTNDDQVTTSSEKAELLSFPCLSQLNIEDCPMFTCMPLYPTLDELILSNSSTKALQQTLHLWDADADAATSYSARPALNNLQSLVLDEIEDSESLLLPELLQRVSYLVEMEITGSPRLISQLPQCITYLSSLEHLKIGCCDQLDFLDECQWQGLWNLLHLTFYEIEKMVCLPKWINHLTTLQYLEICICDSLIDLRYEKHF